jgi:hypothetical protein
MRPEAPKERPSSSSTRSRRTLVNSSVAIASLVLGASLIGWAASNGIGDLASLIPNNDTTTEGSVPPGVPVGSRGEPRGFLTTPAELVHIAGQARDGVEPYATGVAELLDVANQPWADDLSRVESCPSADEPAWLDEDAGAPQLYAKAIAFHLTDEEGYADEVRDGLERIMSTVEVIELDPQRCRLVFAWGTPELVAAADLIEAYWADASCTGPTSAIYGEGQIGDGPCKELFQNWLVKNPYYVVSFSGFADQSNWGAAATTTMATVADYAWDRPDLRLVHRQPVGRDDDEWEEQALTPAEAYVQANQLALDRMNGYRVELHSNRSCDYLAGDQQHPDWPPAKSQITETGIIPEDARRDEFCNVPRYNGQYQNYPQIHLGNLIQQCELMLRRGDRSCYDNVEAEELPDFSFVDPAGDQRSTHLHAGRGSLERAVNAVIVDSSTEWGRPAALAVAYRYYRDHGRLGEVDAWQAYLEPGATAAQDLSFGNLTHGVAEGEPAPQPRVVAPPSD